MPTMFSAIRSVALSILDNASNILSRKAMVKLVSYWFMLVSFVM